MKQSIIFFTVIVAMVVASALALNFWGNKSEELSPLVWNQYKDTEYHYTVAAVANRDIPDAPRSPYVLRGEVQEYGDLSQELFKQIIGSDHAFYTDNNDLMGMIRCKYDWTTEDPRLGSATTLKDFAQLIYASQQVIPETYKKVAFAGRSAYTFDFMNNGLFHYGPDATGTTYELPGGLGNIRWEAVITENNDGNKCIIRYPLYSDDLREVTQYWIDSFSWVY